MKLEKNKFEVNLLLNDPSGLVAHYQSIIEVVVMKFISRGFFSGAEKMELVQKINESLLDRKIGGIQRNYNGSVLLSTYFSKVVYNLCLEINRSQKGKPQLGSEDMLKQVSAKETTPVQKLILDDEVNRLDAILKGVLKISIRLMIALRLYARIPIKDADFQFLNLENSKLLSAFKKNFYTNYDHLKDKEVYKKAIPYLNRITNKDTDADSMRKWMNMQIDKIIELQNGQPPRSKHTRETIRILLQMYFDRGK